MRDFHVPPEDIEYVARLFDPEAWRSCDTEAEAYELRRRRYEARAKVGWTTDKYPLASPPREEG